MTPLMSHSTVLVSHDTLMSHLTSHSNQSRHTSDTLNESQLTLMTHLTSHST